MVNDAINEQGAPSLQIPHALRHHDAAQQSDNLQAGFGPMLTAQQKAELVELVG